MRRTPGSKCSRNGGQFALAIALIPARARSFQPLSIHDGLRRIAKGEVLDDHWSRSAYSVDASHYEVLPEAIVFPSDVADVMQVCQYCSSHDLHIGARGAGTGLLGQSLTDGIIMDFTKHMNRVLEIEKDYVVAEPGVVKAVLDRELRKTGKFLPPDPASSNYCTVGGMISNNSSGIHCLGYGNTVDFIEAVKYVCSDGSEGHADAYDYDERARRLKDLLDSNISLIRQAYPKVSKNSCGYRLDAVINDDKFLPHKVLAASEGTLAILTQATFRILDLPEQKCLLVAGFSDIQGAVSAVPSILGLSPVAVEILDHTVLSAAGSGSETGCLLFVEFAGSSPSAERRLESCKRILGDSCSVLEYASDEGSLTKIWASRKAALNNIMKLTVGSRKPVGLVEDTVVPPESLLEHVDSILHEYKQRRLQYVMYGHAGDGNIHTRPIVDTHSPDQIQLLGEMAARIFKRTVAAGGSITGEHGDGISRTPYIGMQYGRQMLELFRKVKELFDPANLLNPGKKVTTAKLQ